MGLFGKLLDRSVVFSFDRSGFKRHQSAFVDGALDVDLSRTHVVLTGSNSGIGFAAAEALVERGATVTLLCRSAERARTAQRSLQALRANTDVRVVLADMSRLSDVRAAAGLITDPVNVLVHNAGNMLDALRFTEDGLEEITALHVAGPYLLTQLLAPNLEAAAHSGPARVVFVASGGMYTQALDLDLLVTPAEPYDGTRHYALTKRAQVVLAEQMHEHWSAKGVSIHGMHPGWVNTPAIRRAMPYFFRMTQPILRTPAQGADTIVWLAAAKDPEIDANFGFWFDRQRAPLHMSKKTPVDSTIDTALTDLIESWIRVSADD